MSSLAKFKTVVPAAVSHTSSTLFSQSLVKASSQHKSFKRSFNTSSSLLSSSSESKSSLSSISSTSSSSSSSTTSAFPTLAALLVGSGLVAHALTTEDNAAHADASLPTVVSGGAAAAPAPAQKSGKKKKKRDQSRQTLKNPGKFDNVHRDAQNVTQTQPLVGARLQYIYPVFSPTPEHPDMSPDKQVTIMPILSVGGPEGGNAMIQLITNLGQKHTLDATMDMSLKGMTAGAYRYVSGNWSLKPQFQIVPDRGEAIAFEAAYKGQEYTATFSTTNLAEFVFTYNQAITSNLSAGISFQHVLLTATSLGAALKYNKFDTVTGPAAANQTPAEVYAANLRGDVLNLTYYKKAWEAPHPASPAYPPLQTLLAAEYRVGLGSRKSEALVGLTHTRPTYKYTLALHSQPMITMLVEQDVVPGIKFAASGAILHDGSNESQWGVALSIGQ